LSAFDLSNALIVRSRLLKFVPELVDTYGESAAAVAQDWYDTVRESYGLPSHFRAVVPGKGFWERQAVQVERTVHRAAEHVFTGDAAALETALSGPVGKYVQQAGRETIIQSSFADPQASGWRRVTRGETCGFCRMLAGRGAVYMRETAHFASHTRCDCGAVPSWDENAPEVDVDLYKASERMDAMRKTAAAGSEYAMEELAKHRALIDRAINEYT